MNKKLTLGLIASAFFANAAFATEAGPVDGKPVAWRYNVLAKGLDLFERRSGALAPGAALYFKLPKGVQSSPSNTLVEIVLKDALVKLPMVDEDRFILTRDARAASEQADVIVSRQFRPGNYQHPNAEVRTPGLAPDVRRLGDLRLACEVQIELIKADMLKARAVLGLLGTFGFDICRSEKGTDLDAPGMYNTITYVSGSRSDVRTLPKPSGDYTAPLGDASWPDDTLIEFKLDGRPAKR